MEKFIFIEFDFNFEKTYITFPANELFHTPI